MFLLQLFVLIIYQQVDDPFTSYCISFVSLGFNLYFICYEILQIIAQKKNYFTDFLNLIDIARISTVFYYIMSKQIEYDVEPEFKAAMFFLLWIKIFKYLSVFSAFRYFVMMVGETIADIKTFLTILFIAMIAYGQIMLTISENED